MYAVYGNIAMPSIRFVALKRALLFLGLIPLLSSCSMLISSTIIEPTVGNLQQQTDLELVCEGAPAYLLMIDSMIAGDPDSKNLLRIGSQAYTGYITAMAECNMPKERVMTIAEKGRLHGTSLLSKLLPISPGTDEKEFQKALNKLTTCNVPNLFWGTLAWLNWIQVQQGSPASLADLAMVEKMMVRLIELDESFQAGSSHLFFGAYYATRPAMLGGDPEKSRTHFERALQLSDRKFLIVQVLYAETLSRQLFDQQLHDALLKEVLEFPIDDAPEYALSNQVAKRKARRLLDEDYFAE